MNWASAREFFAMGGYGLYVWGSYALAAACIVVELWGLRRRRRTVLWSVSRTGEKRDSDR